jgi:hypothetical protein
MKSKRQTMAKVAREREVKVRRARKLEKKYAAAAERKAKAEGSMTPPNAEAFGAGTPVLRLSTSPGGGVVDARQPAGS